MNWPNMFDQLQWIPTHQVNPGCAENAWVKDFDMLFPGMKEKLADTPQDPIHHAEGDVWTHTKMVVNEMLAHPTYHSSNPVERFILWWSAALHDICKPQTTRTQDNGQVIAPGHSRQGAVWSRHKLWTEDTPVCVREMVSKMIYYHQTPFHAFSDRSGMTAEFLLRKMSLDCNVSLLTALAQSDMRGRICQDQQKSLQDIELFSLLAHELGCWSNPYAFPDGRTASQYVLTRGQRDADTSVYSGDCFEVIMLSGPPASGKDTWCQEHGQGRPVLSYDDARQQLGLKHGDKTGTVVHHIHDQARELLRTQTSFIWNATHMTENMRGPALSLIRQYGGSPTIVCLEAPPQELVRRNNARNNTLKSDKLLQMVEKWEYPFSWEADSVVVPNVSARPKHAFK